MSNRHKTDLPVIEVEQHQVREVLRCLLHTIIFNRALGLVKPQEVESELFDVTYVRCGDEAVDSKVEEKISAFCSWIDRHPGKRGQVSLLFYESRRKQANWLGIPQEERLYWEQWCINTAIVPSSVSLHEQSSPVTGVRGARQARLQLGVEEALRTILTSVNEHKDHIPAVTSSYALTFPFDITITGEGGVMFGLDAFKRMIMHTSPPPVLS
ncbi:hypothetical protein WJX73_009590 [Symbiochloris irregularis]|uniref:Autophagy-related protein 101 n=1 Tax=Symbiochloris irregularis TaxID=706552 RepID=A0AAW1P169_9CHLO